MTEKELIALALSGSKKKRMPAFLKEGIGDDCAVMALDKKWDLLVTCDTLSEGTHFLKGTAPEKIARKLLAVNLSDIAAMAGTPLWGILSLSAPGTLADDFWKRFFNALGKEAEKYGTALVGGDTVRGGSLVLTLTLAGRVEKGRAVLRSGAKPGDLVVVTGRLGNTLKSGKHLAFEPRLREARWLRDKFSPGAMMDLSDGLLEDGRKLAEASGVSLALSGGSLPLAAGADLKSALTDGEDFELLLTVPEKNWQEKSAALFRKKFGLELTAVGRVVKKGREPLVLDGKSVEWNGYAHF